jgi:hypothetical protein
MDRAEGVTTHVGVVPRGGCARTGLSYSGTRSLKSEVRGQFFQKHGGWPVLVSVAAGPQSTALRSCA